MVDHNFLSRILTFNISHSGDWVAVLLHINESEKVRSVLILNFPKNEIFLHSWRILRHKQSKNGLLNNFNEEQAFYRCWCLREAVIEIHKVLGL